MSRWQLSPLGCGVPSHSCLSHSLSLVRCFAYKHSQWNWTSLFPCCSLHQGFLGLPFQNGNEGVIGITFWLVFCGKNTRFYFEIARSKLSRCERVFPTVREQHSCSRSAHSVQAPWLRWKAPSPLLSQPPFSWVALWHSSGQWDVMGAIWEVCECVWLWCSVCLCVQSVSIWVPNYIKR